MADGLREQLGRDGVLTLVGIIDPDLVRTFVERIEAAIDVWAAELQVSRHDYLDAACRWSSPNLVVDDLVAACADVLAPSVEELLGPGLSPGRASVFRKSSAASLGTHGHQDASYWVRPSSSRYALTTWVALDAVDEARGALRVLPGSHLGEVGPPIDFLQPGFVDPAASWGNEARTLPAEPGDVVVFGPRLWHGSHSVACGTVRRALAIRWVGGSHSDQVALPQDLTTQFGMYTSGDCLHRALSSLGGEEVPQGMQGVEWALQRGVVDGLPDPAAARHALLRLQIHLQAVERHRASGQRGMVWDAIRDLVVLPVLGERRAKPRVELLEP